MILSPRETVSDLNSRSQEEQSNLLSEITQIRSSLGQLHDNIQGMRQGSAEKSTASTDDILVMMHCKLDALTVNTNSQLDSISSFTKSCQSSILSLRGIGQQIIQFLSTFPNEIRELLQK